MKTIGILGTSSDAGKSWVATAFCALLHRKGYKVAPFKAQNMSNNAYATLEGGEMGVAQAAQAEACGMRPVCEMNPILLKPMQENRSQVIVEGKPLDALDAQSYFNRSNSLWEIVADTLDGWKKNCDVLITEGAGSPVELNLMDRDITNLRPIRHTDGRWLLVSDIERGGVFAQIAGTWQLIPEEDKRRGLGNIVNKFRGDISLFEGAEKYLSPYCSMPYIGVLPMKRDLQPDQEDGMALPENHSCMESANIVCICLPRISNATDMQPWFQDKGVHFKWIQRPEEVGSAKLIIIPGSKNTCEDLEWLLSLGWKTFLEDFAKKGGVIIGICGGYQMLGQSISDPMAVESGCKNVEGLGLLPVRTVLEEEKVVRRITASWLSAEWEAYEIHHGKTETLDSVDSIEPLLKVRRKESFYPEGIKQSNVMGSYVHGFFDHPVVRSTLCEQAGIKNHLASPETWMERKQKLYGEMADLLESSLNLDPIWKYLES